MPTYFRTPPCAPMILKRADVAGGSLELTLSPGHRIGGGILTAFGATFASTAAGSLRLPLPLPFKVIPLLFVALGTGISALGASRMTAEHTIRVDRRRGVTFRWRTGPTATMELLVERSNIAGFEIQCVTHQRGGAGTSDWGSSSEWTEVEHRLMLVTRQGEAYGVDRFGLREQANIRKRLVEDVLA